MITGPGPGTTTRAILTDGASTLSDEAEIINGIIGGPLERHSERLERVKEDTLRFRGRRFYIWFWLQTLIDPVRLECRSNCDAGRASLQLPDPDLEDKLDQAIASWNAHISTLINEVITLQTQVDRLLERQPDLIRIDAYTVQIPGQAYHLRLDTDPDEYPGIAFYGRYEPGDPFANGDGYWSFELDKPGMEDWMDRFIEHHRALLAGEKTLV